jgi:hypothetical protein
VLIITRGQGRRPGSHHKQQEKIPERDHWRKHRTISSGSVQFWPWELHLSASDFERAVITVALRERDGPSPADFP